MESGSGSQLVGENALREALENKQFDLLYQPVIELGAGRVRKAEALIRWRHPDLGMLSPQAFIPLAERSGWIREIGAWVLARAIRDLGALLTTHPDFQLSLNVSPVQIESDGFNESVFARHLGEHGVPASRLILEITEGFALQNSDTNRAKLARLKAIGLKLAIDDFGMGHSALNSLIHFPCDYIKLDRTFIRSNDESRATRAVAALIVGMAHELDLQVIAEGVETEAELAHVLALGCDHAQGYYWHRPCTFEQLRAILDQGRPA